MFGRKRKECSEVCFEIKAGGGASLSIDAVKLIRSITTIHPKAVLKIETTFTSRGHKSLIKVSLPPNAGLEEGNAKIIEAILQSLVPPDVSFTRVSCDGKNPF
ncbi:MAG: hypothetical protein J7J20_01145 [Desulfurococcales archaeon]|nr:hypothetical protein [Desulfurococcales archaeon]